MIHRVKCPKCNSDLEYDDKSVWEGNREHEDYECPICGTVVGSAFTDAIPTVRVIKRGDDK